MNRRNHFRTGLLIGVILVGSLMACGLSSPLTANRDVASELVDSTPTTSAPPGSAMQYYIPADLEVPPDDILQQIGFYQGGASYCFRRSIIEGNELLLVGYGPHQKLRVLLYKRMVGFGRFATEWSVMMDGSGHARLTMSGSDPEDYQFIVADAGSGQILEWGRLCSDNPVLPGGGWGPGSKVMAQRSVRELDIRTGPGYDQRVETVVPNDQVVTITGDSTEIERERWWPVRCDTGHEGWISELWVRPAQ